MPPHGWQPRARGIMFSVGVDTISQERHVGVFKFCSAQGCTDSILVVKGQSCLVNVISPLAEHTTTPRSLAFVKQRLSPACVSSFVLTVRPHSLVLCLLWTGIVRASSLFPILSNALLMLGGLCAGVGRIYSGRNNILLSAGILFVAAGRTKLKHTQKGAGTKRLCCTHRGKGSQQVEGKDRLPVKDTLTSHFNKAYFDACEI